MPYITKRTPTPRTTDKPLGKMLGYLAELLEYLKWENYAWQIDIILPDWFPINIIQGCLIDICKAVYNATFQRAYNSGADKGNEMNNQIMGWVDQLKSQAYAKIDEAKSYIETNLINPIKTKINNEIMPKINDAMSRLSTLRTDVNKAFSDLTSMGNRLSGMDTSIKNFDSKLSSFNTTLTDLQSKASALDTNLKDAQTKISNLISQINTANSNIKAINDKLAQYKALLDDLDKRVRALEGRKEGLPVEIVVPTGLPSIFKS